MAMKNPVTTKNTPALSSTIAVVGNLDPTNLLTKKDVNANKIASETKKKRGGRCVWTWKDRIAISTADEKQNATITLTQSMFRCPIRSPKLAARDWSTCTAVSRSVAMDDDMSSAIRFGSGNFIGFFLLKLV